MKTQLLLRRFAG